VSGVLADTLAKFQIDSELRVAHFLAQTCEESDGYCTTVEYASGAAYEGRADLGNTQLGDGVRFEGRGLIQLTGRANYDQYGDLLQLDLVGDPDLASEPATSLLIACEYWQQHKLNAFADQDDIETITRRIMAASMVSPTAAPILRRPRWRSPAEARRSRQKRGRSSGSATMATR
jgi:putative chitinase